MIFESVQPGVPDPMYNLKKRADSDLSPSKVDLGVGIYRNEQGAYQELQCVKEAKQVLAKIDLGHDYELTTGNPGFLKEASGIMFGQGGVSPAKGSCHRTSLRASNLTNWPVQLASVQTISGSGAVHLAALFISRCISPYIKVFVGVPTWGNYKPALDLVGLQTIEYRHYDPSTRSYDHDSTILAIKEAPEGSAFIFQGCCHNPTGADPTPEQWSEIVDALKVGRHLPLFDLAYQGLGQGLDEDAYAVSLCARRRLEFLACQSLSKNFALYGERCGSLHVICKDSRAAANVHDQLRCLIRWEMSSTPAYGSRLVKLVLQDGHMNADW
ncbi:uncharacterized protein TrAtP1_010370 [Trichoderma atroviride]|uniref:uncharacterized protein n=1 Tax=Hypocrea atroviridis TaxID=63577 RepID=UPI00332F241C|nr:hypothetical protein TrAtP1_010370 [Trichoderma atroviride]